MEKEEELGTNNELVEKIKKNILHDDEIIDLAELFKVFGDSTRMKIINALFFSWI